MQPRSAIAWIARCGLGALLGMLACGITTAVIGDRLQLPAVTTRDGTVITMNRYLREATPDIVLVGSSLTFRIKEEYFATQPLRNLALPGGSPVTGLAMVADQPQLPRIILVEANLLSRPLDDALVARYAAGHRPERWFFRPVRTAVAAYENWMHAPPNREQTAREISRLLRQPPSSFDSHVYVDRVVGQANAEDPTNGLRDSIDRTRALIAAVEARGTQVLLFELPTPGRVSETRFVRITHDMVRAAFPQRARWLALNLPDGELRWADGFHLDERSAVIVARSIDRALASRAAAH